MLEATEQISDIGLNDNGELVLEDNRLPVSECIGIKKDSDSPPPSFDNNRLDVLSRVSLALPPEKIRQALQDLLRVGFETRLGGLFLVIPFLLQARLERFACMLWPTKQKGIQPVQALLLIIFATMTGLKLLSKLSSYQDIGLAVLAGLPKLPTPASIHQFLDQVKPVRLNKTKLSLSRALRRIGIILRRIINIDMHVIEYFGRERLLEGHYVTKNKPVRCWCILLAQDQEMANPIYHKVFLSHLNPIELLPGFVKKLKEIIGQVAYLAYSMFNLLHNQLDGRFRSMTPESMFENLFNRKAPIQLIGDRLVVTFDYFQGQETVIERFRNLNQKHACFNIDPKVSWFGGAKI